MDAKEFVRLKEELENKRAASARLQGKHDILLQRLEQEYECQSIIEAEKLLTQWEEQLTSLEQDFQTKLDAYQKKHGAKLAM